MEKELLAEALTTLEKLRTGGLFFHSAIELGYELDGEEYKKELDALISKIKDALNRVG